LGFLLRFTFDTQLLKMDKSLLATTPEPPYYAVIFSSVKNKVADGYDVMAVEMEQLAKQQDGFLGVESARNEVGITVSYWESLEAISKWKANTKHLMAQKQGREEWYANYKVRICRVERDYEF
jgi:heme-degrading monooxygenase HmoA